MKDSNGQVTADKGIADEFIMACSKPKNITVEEGGVKYTFSFVISEANIAKMQEINQKSSENEFNNVINVIKPFNSQNGEISKEGSKEYAAQRVLQKSSTLMKGIDHGMLIDGITNTIKAILEDDDVVGKDAKQKAIKEYLIEVEDNAIKSVEASVDFANNTVKAFNDNSQQPENVLKSYASVLDKEDSARMAIKTMINGIGATFSERISVKVSKDMNDPKVKAEKEQVDMRNKLKSFIQEDTGKVKDSITNLVDTLKQNEGYNKEWEKKFAINLTNQLVKVVNKFDSAPDNVKADALKNFFDKAASLADKNLQKQTPGLINALTRGSANKKFEKELDKLADGLASALKEAAKEEAKSPKATDKADKGGKTNEPEKPTQQKTNYVKITNVTVNDTSPNDLTAKTQAGLISLKDAQAKQKTEAVDKVLSVSNDLTAKTVSSLIPLKDAQNKQKSGVLGDVEQASNDKTKDAAKSVEASKAKPVVSQGRG